MPREADELLCTFLDEADEHLAALEQGLLRVSDGTPDADLLNAVFRAAHSIKGGSGLFGFEAVTRLTHALEQLLDRLRKGQLPITRDRIDLLLRAVDGLTGLLAAARDGSAAASVVPDEMIGELDAAAGVKSSPQAAPCAVAESPSGDGVHCVTITPGPHLLTNGVDPLLLLRNLGRLGELSDVAADLSRLPQLDALCHDRCYLTWAVTIRSTGGAAAISSVFQFVEEDCTIEITPASPPGGVSLTSLRRSGVFESLANFARQANSLANWAVTSIPIRQRLRGQTTRLD